METWLNKIISIPKVAGSIMFTGLIQSIGTIKKNNMGVVVDGCKPFSPISLAIVFLLMEFV